MEIELPAEIFNGNPEGFLEYLGLIGRKSGPGTWSVGAAPSIDLLRSFNLADQTGRDQRFDLVNRMSSSVAVDPDAVSEGLAQLHVRLLERIRSGDLTALFHGIQAEIASGRDNDAVLGVVRDGYNSIGEIRLESSDERAFSRQSAHLIVATEELIRRIRLPAVLFRFAQDPSPMSTLRTAAEDAEGGGLFASSSDWYTSVIGLSEYLGPLLGCLTPRCWGFQASRALAAIVFAFGTDINGIRSAPMETIQLLPARSPGERRSTPINYRPRTCGDAIDWWVMRLNQMFNYLSDPVTFAESDGRYAPHEHHHWLLTVGQIFAQTTSMQCSVRDFTAQRALMNGVLDAFAGRVMDVEFERLVTLKYATKRRDKVRDAMPTSVADLLLPAADRALEALRGIQDGFFIRRQRGESQVSVRLPDGRWQKFSPESAAAKLLLIQRNATHGFGHKKGPSEKNQLATALLVHHDGQIPADIVLLPYLYLLDMLCTPDRIRANISRRVASG